MHATPNGAWFNLHNYSLQAMDPKSAKEGKAKMTALFQKYVTSLDYSYICFRGNARLRLFPS